MLICSAFFFPTSLPMLSYTNRATALLRFHVAETLFSFTFGYTCLLFKNITIYWCCSFCFFRAKNYLLFSDSCNIRGPHKRDFSGMNHTERSPWNMIYHGAYPSTVAFAFSRFENSPLLKIYLGNGYEPTFNRSRVPLFFKRVIDVVSPFITFVLRKIYYNLRT